MRFANPMTIADGKNTPTTRFDAQPDPQSDEQFRAHRPRSVPSLPGQGRPRDWPRAVAHLVLAIVVGCALGCAHASTHSAEPDRSTTMQDAHDAPPPSMPSILSETPSTDEALARIDRATLLAILDHGLGYFLRSFSLQPALDGGEFLGFRIAAIHAEDMPSIARYIKVDDVIVSINGMPIERPEQAARVWRNLRVASALVLHVLRDERHHRYSFAIVNGASKARRACRSGAHGSDRADTPAQRAKPSAQLAAFTRAGCPPADSSRCRQAIAQKPVPYGNLTHSSGVHEGGFHEGS